MQSARCLAHSLTTIQRIILFNYQALLGLKKKKYMKDLCMAAPMGLCPAGVDPDVAGEFVKTFIKRLNIKKFGALKTRLKEVMKAGHC